MPFKSSDECLCLTQPPMTGCCWHGRSTTRITATNVRTRKRLAAMLVEVGFGLGLG